MGRSRLAIIGAACLLLSARPGLAQTDTTHTRTPPAARSLAELRARFRQARRPTGKILVGRWTMVQLILRERSRDGRHIEKHYGARREDVPGNPLAWVLEVRRRPDSRYEVSHRLPGTTYPDSSVLRFRATDVFFEKDYGGHSLVPYRCRVLGERRLVCLNADDPVYDAREFTKDP